MPDVALVLAGVPSPAMAWYKDAALLRLEKLSRFQLLADGSLQISGLLPDDTGMFQCFARNAAGEVQTTTYLAVTSRCQLPPQPWNLGCPTWVVGGVCLGPPPAGLHGGLGDPGKPFLGDGITPGAGQLQAGQREGLQGWLCVCPPRRHRPQHHQGSPGQHGD